LNRVTPPDMGAYQHTFSIEAAEVGTIDDYTVVVTFSDDVVSPTTAYKLGVTITAAGSPMTIVSATRQVDHTKVHYVLASPVILHTPVTIDYSAAVGNLADSAGNELANIVAQSVTNNVPNTDVYLMATGDKILMATGDAIRMAT
jgi:hypothetical protein